MQTGAVQLMLSTRSLLCRGCDSLLIKCFNPSLRCYADRKRNVRRCFVRTTEGATFSALAHNCKASYSTSYSSRFSKAADDEANRQYTTTFVSSSVVNPTPPTNSSNEVLPIEEFASPAHSLESTARVSFTKEEEQDTESSGDSNATGDRASSSTPSDVAEFYELFLKAQETAQSGAPPADALTAQDTQPIVPTALELLPPRPTEEVRVSLLSRLRPDSTAVEDALSGAARPTTEAAAKPVNAYTDAFRDCFVNPFNGRLTSEESPTAKLLFSLGFFRSLTNWLHLEWSPTEFVTALQRVMAEQQKARANRRTRVLRRQRRDRRAARAAAALRKKNRKVAPVTVEKGQTDAETGEELIHPINDSLGEVHGAQNTASTTAGVATGSDESSCDYASLLAACEPLPAAEAVAAARAKLLLPLRRRGPKHWTATVAAMMERQDVFTFLNKEMERLYAELSVAYVPPKLDTPVDTTVADTELTKDQRRVMQLAVRGFNIFVGGSAGTGKTVLLKAIFRELTRLGLRVAVTATTGVAAVQLGGCTFHHAFNAPVDAVPHRWDANALRAVDAVIVDEVSLLDANMFDAFDMEARLARVSHVPFGGLQVIVCGDFLQLSREDTMPAYESAAFRYLVAVRLVTPMRHIAGDPLLQLLEALRRGEFNAEQFQALDRAIPPSTTHITYIFPRRREAQQLNEAKLGELESREMTFTPQRGPLQLCGTFTKSALIEVRRDEKGMQRPLPRREQVLEMVQAEAQRLCAGAGGGGGGDGGAPHIADHELVLMPVRNGSGSASAGPSTAAASTRFILRLRCPETRTSPSAGAADASGSRTALTGENGGGGSHSSSSASTLAPTASVASAYGPMVKSTTSSKLLGLDARRAHRAASLFTDSVWEAVASAVATRLGGRLVALYDPEPASLVPLSVSMTLADMTSPDIAHSLSPLRLKLGCRVMVNRNLSRTVSNGSVGIVEAFAPPDPSLFPRTTDRARRTVFRRLSQSKLFEQLPVVRLLSGEVVQVPPVSLLIGGTAQSYYYGHEVLTVPLQLGYAFTVHKVQGLTLQGTVVLDCEKFFDCPHLIYVACSRVRSMDQLVVRHVEPRMIIVRRSALEFSEGLQEACALNPQALPSTCVRGAWALRTAQRVLPISD